ncbi:MAG: Na+/H+ antiporter subunit E [Salinisphaera sp.]|nr:Na+/H+ antiporter subunit E [Salinisphaera sp.]
MSRWLPHPLLTAFLLLAWLLLQQSLSPGTIVVGLLLALLLARVLDKLELPPVRIRRYDLLCVLLLRVFHDLVRSNIAVARIVLFPRQLHSSGFVRIPLELTSPHALATLACIITATPGTVWVSHDSYRHVLVIHVLDLTDKAAWVRHIKQRYERPLLEIFP